MKDTTLKPIGFSGYHRVPVCALYEEKSGLYIGTRGYGMFVVTPGQKEAKLQTSGDIRNISFILPDKEKLLVGTDKILYRGYQTVSLAFIQCERLSDFRCFIGRRNFYVGHVRRGIPIW